MIYIAPDRTGYTNLPQHIISPELETLTGADMMISNFPIEQLNESTLQAHIQAKALFVQIKIGYDVLNFDGLHNFCARVQKARIPKNQAILLRVGDYWKDDDGLLRVRSSKPYGNTSWRDFRRAMIACELRGVTVSPECLQSMDELPEWIEDYQSIVNKVSNEGKRELYPVRPVPRFQPEDIWQEMIEVQPNDPRYIMVAGLDKFGEKRAISTFQYIVDNFPHIRVEHDNGKSEYVGIKLYHFWKVLTDEDEKGKAVHNIPGWGNGLRRSFREIIGLDKGKNLSIRGSDDFDYVKGWEAFRDEFRTRVSDGENANKVFNELSRMVDEFK